MLRRLQVIRVRQEVTFRREGPHCSIQVQPFPNGCGLGHVNWRITWGPNT